jgi:hypothetical protein
MTHLLSILAIAAALLAVVVILLRDSLGKRRTARDSYAAMEAAGSLTPVQVPPAELMERIFAEDDLSFVSCQGVRSIRRQFVQDRRRIAISWLGLTRREAIRILRVHLSSVRTSRSLHPVVEFRLLLHTLFFFAVYALLWGIVASYGAIWARSFMRNAVALAGGLSALGARILADADRSGLRLAQSHGNA